MNYFRKKVHEIFYFICDSQPYRISYDITYFAVWILFSVGIEGETKNLPFSPTGLVDRFFCQI
jgi:hypothetical protein